jgi:mono/diheme cytochrome c family protein
MFHVKAFLQGISLSLFLLAGLMPVHTASGADLSKGKSIYMEVCKTCHGLDGKGERNVQLNPPPADLTGADVQRKLDIGLFKSIHDGRKNTAMGAWKYALSDEEIREVIGYVRTLGGGATALPKP